MRSQRLKTPLALAAAAALVAACGGGGGGDNPPQAVITQIKGVAATGAAMAGAAVRVKCVVGTGTGTTASDGSYTLNISNATLPCVLSALSADGRTELRSVVPADAGQSPTVQINPLTELIVARTVGQDAAAYFAAFDAAAAARLAPASLTAATTAVMDTLKRGGVDFGAIANPISAALVPATQGTPGNEYDQKLDALGRLLSDAGSTLAQFSAQMVAAAQGNSGPTTSPTSALPPELLLRPAHPDCATLRSGVYRLVGLNKNLDSPGANLSSLVTLDAKTLELRFDEGSTDQGVSEGGCTFAFDGGKTRVVVSPAGVLFYNGLGNDSNSGRRLGLGIPEQPASLAALAGSWNYLNNYVSSGSPLQIKTKQGSFDLAATGAMSNVQDCDGLLPCVADTNPPVSLRLNPSGGYELVRGGPPLAQVFLYQPAGDAPLMLMSSSDGATVAARATALRLRTPGETWGAWDVSVTQTGSISPLFSISNYEVVANDAVAQTYLRARAQDGVNNLFAMNKPRNGLAYRAGGPTPNRLGASVTVSEVHTLPISAAGITAFVGRGVAPAAPTPFFGITVFRPSLAASLPAEGPAANTLNWAGNTQVFALRMNWTVSAATGSISSGGYDFHTLAGTTTPCTRDSGNENTCIGAAAALSNRGQSGLINAQGAVAPTAVVIGPDSSGFTFNGTVTGTTYHGSWTKTATPGSPTTGTGRFQAAVSITLN